MSDGPICACKHGMILPAFAFCPHCGDHNPAFNPSMRVDAVRKPMRSKLTKPAPRGDDGPPRAA